MTGSGTPSRACSPSCCTPTCRGWPTTAAGRSARNGCTSPGPASYLPVDRGARTNSGRRGPYRDLLTLGVTPVLAAQLDDPHCLDGMHHWLGELAAARPRGRRGPRTPIDASSADVSTRRPRRHSTDVRDTTGATAAHAVLRPCPTPGRSRLLGGPLAHPFQPLLDPRLRDVLPPRGSRGRRRRWGTRADRHLGPGMRLHPRHGNRVRRSRSRAFHGRRPCAARRHRARPAGAAIPTSSRSAETCRSATACGPRSPAIRATRAYRDFHTYDHDDRTQARPGHRPPRRRRTTRRPTTRRPLRRPSTATSTTSSTTVRRDCARNPIGSADPRSWSPRSTPNCSGTGGTRARSGWRRCCAHCPTRESSVGTLADARDRGYVGAPVDLQRFVVGIGQGLAGVGRRRGRRPGRD